MMKALSSGDRKVVLLVEDNPVLAMIFVATLRATEFRAVCFDSVEAALEWLDGGNDPDVIVSDLEFPGEALNGYDFWEGVRARRLGTPFIFWSSVTLDLFRLGVRVAPDLLPKPCPSPEVLQEHLDRVVS